MKRPQPSSEGPTPFVRRAVLWLVWAERVVFFAIGVLLFLAAIALLKDSAVVLLKMYVGGVFRQRHTARNFSTWCYWS